MLTGKCKEDFDRWISQRHDTSPQDSRVYYFGLAQDVLHGETTVPFEMAYGVYVDFFLSEFKMLLTIDWYENGEFEDVLISEIFTEHTEDGLPLRKTLSEARQKAVEKANEIYNLNKEQ
jgi:hypothetical protein